MRVESTSDGSLRPRRRLVVSVGRLRLVGAVAGLVAGVLLSGCAGLLPDGFADDLPDVRVDEATDPIALDQVTGEDGFPDGVKPPEITESVQPPGVFVFYETWFLGSYQADVWLGSQDKGVVWFKLYELTTGEGLSPDGVREDSLTRVEPVSGGGDVQRVEVPEFTVYEGDVGFPYYARVELWFQPDDGELTFLSDQILRIEGYEH